MLRTRVGGVVRPISKMGFAESLGDQDFNGLAQEFRTLVAKEFFALRVYFAYFSVVVSYDDGIR